MLKLLPPAYAPGLPPVFIGNNRAGSVGKTTVGFNLCVQIAMRGWRVLLIDADLQSDASYWSGWDGDYVPAGVATVHTVMLGRASLAEATVQGRTRIAGDPDNPYADELFKPIPNLHIVRGDKAMSQADSELTQDPRGVFWLLSALRRDIKPGDYDLIYIDCPASLGRLSMSLMIASTSVMVCIKPTRKELRGALALTKEIADLREAYADFDVTTQVVAYLINEGKKHTSQGRFYINIQDEAKATFGDLLLPTVHSAVFAPEAYDAQEPLAIWEPEASTVEALNAIADRMGFTDRAAA